LPEDNLKRDHFKFITRTWRIRLGLASPRKQVLGGHFSINRSDFAKVNGFDEKFVGWGGEDIDLGIRLVSSGVYGRSVIRSARVLHMWHAREKNSEDWKKGVNMDYFNRKHIKPVCDVGLKKLT
jgi:predicted glycosyltransferase involved in capsule biosynthesis